MTRMKRGGVDLGTQCIYCDDPVIAKDLCYFHYNRQYRGTPLDAPDRRTRECEIPWCKTTCNMKYCKDHRYRQEAWGNPLADAPFTKKALEAFWKQVDKRGESMCWPWTGPVHRDRGRGKDYKRGIVRHHGERIAWVSRVVWLLGTGKPVPDGDVISWTCGNNLCCNYRHMKTVLKGRHLNPG